MVLRSRKRQLASPRRDNPYRILDRRARLSRNIFITFLILSFVYVIVNQALWSNQIMNRKEPEVLSPEKPHDVQVVEDLEEIEEKCEGKRKEPLWEWHIFRKNKTTTRNFVQESRRSLLIAQYAPHGKLLEVASKVNVLYAQKWRVDYVLVQGSTILLPGERDCEPPIGRATYDRIDLLQLALRKKNYEYVLIMDENCMLYDFERDITTILPDSMMLAMQSGIENGIFLWNLRHPYTPEVAEDWKKAALDSLSLGNKTGVLTHLQSILGQGDRKSSVHNLVTAFKEKEGSVVRRFNPDTEWDPIDSSVGEVCQARPPMCKDFCSSKAPRRTPEWNWRFYHSNSTKSKDRRMLVAQYSAFGSYARLLELTSPINKAYARKWNHDYVILQGAAVSIPRDSWCIPPEERSRFNKIALLHLALARRKQYDMLLLLDADAMVYDFSKDLRAYVPPGHMLAAQRVDAADDAHAWNLNDGVTIWDLHHPLTQEVVDDWYQMTRDVLRTNPTTRQYMLTGDQALLQEVLKIGDRSNSVYTYTDEFQYRNATVVKHFIRENLDWEKHDVWAMTSLDERTDNIQNTSREVCERFAPACEGIEHTVYTK